MVSDVVTQLHFRNRRRINLSVNRKPLMLSAVLHFPHLLQLPHLTTSMDTRRLARLMGALCFEERLQIIGALIPVGAEGLDQQALADVTELSQMAVTVHIEYMLSTDMVKVKYTATGKRYSADLDLLEKLFTHMSEHYGAGTRLLAVDGKHAVPLIAA
jgi:hypothetical protein